MDFSWQHIIVLLFLIAAVVYLVRFIKRSTSGHDGCDGCDVPGEIMKNSKKKQK